MGAQVISSGCKSSNTVMPARQSAVQMEVGGLARTNADSGIYFTFYYENHSFANIQLTVPDEVSWGLFTL